MMRSMYSLLVLVLAVSMASAQDCGAGACPVTGKTATVAKKAESCQDEAKSCGEKAKTVAAKGEQDEKAAKSSCCAEKAAKAVAKGEKKACCEAKLAAREQDEKAGKTPAKDCCGTEAATVAKVQDEKKDCCKKCDGAAKTASTYAKVGDFTPCENLVAFLDAKKLADGGCKCSTQKLAAMEKATPGLTKVAKLYESATGGCEKSKGELTQMVAAWKAAEKTKGSCDAGSCGDAKTVAFAPCDAMKSYMAVEAAAAKGCETSKTKLAAMSKENPQLADLVATYHAAEKGCEKSKAKLAKFVGDMNAKKAAKGSCDAGSCGDAKTVAFKPCDMMKSYMAVEAAAAKGCETSKTKLVAMSKENPQLADLVATYHAAEKGCEKSKAKLAKFVSDMNAKKAAAGSCDAKSECSGEVKTTGAKGDCGDAGSCSGEVKTTGAEGSCDAKTECSGEVKTTGAKSDCGAGACPTGAVKQL